MLAQGSLIVASYNNVRLGNLDRHRDFFVTWTYGSLGSLLVLMLVGGVLGILEDSNFSAVITFGLSLLTGLVLAFRYSLVLPPMAQQSVTVINGQSRELIYACREFSDQPLERLVRIPLGDLVVKLSWGQIADHSPSFIGVFLCANPSTGDGNQNWPSLCLANQNHQYPAPAPEELIRKAKDFSETLGARYVGLEPWVA
ncbi:hypothetical protein ASC87_22295 [Rhizobacter sp. Root1221]|nr:hypothetical protein ASC87_22295 [Rhizobacter sp. Root1221]